MTSFDFVLKSQHAFIPCYLSHVDKNTNMRKHCHLYSQVFFNRSTINECISKKRVICKEKCPSFTVNTSSFVLVGDEHICSWPYIWGPSCECQEEHQQHFLHLCWPLSRLHWRVPHRKCALRLHESSSPVGCVLIAFLQKFTWFTHNVLN